MCVCVHAVQCEVRRRYLRLIMARWCLMQSYLRVRLRMQIAVWSLAKTTKAEYGTREAWRQRECALFIFTKSSCYIHFARWIQFSSNFYLVSYIWFQRKTISYCLSVALLFYFYFFFSTPLSLTLSLSRSSSRWVCLCRCSAVLLCVSRSWSLFSQLLLCSINFRRKQINCNPNKYGKNITNNVSSLSLVLFHRNTHPYVLRAMFAN